MAERLERWLPNLKVSSSNLSENLSAKSLEIWKLWQKYIVKKYILVIELSYLEILFNNICQQLYAHLSVLSFCTD